MNTRITTLTMLGLFANLADELEFAFFHSGVPIEKRTKIELLCQRIRTATSTAFAKWAMVIDRDDLSEADKLAKEMKELSMSIDGLVYMDKFITAIIKITKGFNAKTTNEQTHNITRALLTNAENAEKFIVKNEVTNIVCKNAFNLIETFDRIIRAGKEEEMEM